MGRILSIDYGAKRTGLAVTDPLNIIVSGLDTVETKNLQDFLKSYLTRETVTKIVIGLPTHKDGNFTSLKPKIDELELFISNNYNTIEIDFYDESYTSMEAKIIILQSGVKKSKRRDKSLVDKISAVLILQKYLGHI